jgi:replicative DNA helicase
MRFSIEAEQSVIGGLLIDPSKLDDVCELITDADYYNSDNRAVFAAICAMANDNQPIDVITLSEKLDAMGELERIGGIGYLIEMHNNTP